MSDLDEIFDSASGQISPRLFTPTKFTIKQTTSLNDLLNELERINRIYLTDFDICRDELKNLKLDVLVDELYFLKSKHSISLKNAFIISNFNRDFKSLKEINDTIQKMEVLYTKMIMNLYLPI